MLDCTAALAPGTPELSLLFCEQEHSPLNSAAVSAKAVILFVIFMVFMLASTINMPGVKLLMHTRYKARKNIKS
ncbi:hypothetical protein KL86CLO1_12403 [uncultured Eubacteriales bacterium]|uniref:Uncharacterized protein n=1 Tax=uncultured Eubacteriales bacterium TaxID=172733 RepID=A0A212K918_9FIRM|nr:hypothetical protein KL86CLO1_12403 [uncultured Eubacteriales bacterium]